MAMPHVIEVNNTLVTEVDLATLRALFTRRMREVPGAVAIIATSLEGERQGLAATAWCSLSADPPTILICVNRTAGAHDLIVKSQIFSVNQLANSHAEIIAVFSNQRGLKGDARFAEAAWRTGVGGAPMLVEALTAYECAVTSHVVFATHSIFIGQVVDIQVNEGMAGPATYFQGGLHAVAPI